MKNLSKIEPKVFEWFHVVALIISIPFGLFILYFGLKYPMPWLIQQTKLFSLLLIPVWLVTLTIITFVLGFSLFCLVAELAILADRVIRITLVFVKNTTLLILITRSDSPALYSLISPHWAVSRLIKLPTKKCEDILNEISEHDLVNILSSYRGLLLLSTLPANWRSMILGNLKIQGVRLILNCIDEESYPNYTWLLNDITHEQLEQYLYFFTFTDRKRKESLLNKIGIDTPVSEDRKPYLSHGG